MDIVFIILKWALLIVVLIGGALFFYIRYLANRTEKTYYKSGVLQSEYPQKNLKVHGLCKRYYENGNLEFEGYFECDLPCGEQKTYYENGTLKEKNKLKIVVIQDNERKFRRSILDGEGINYDENGKVISKTFGTFENNLEIRKAYQIDKKLENSMVVGEFAILLKETIYNYNTMTIVEKTYHSNNMIKQVERRKNIDILWDKSKLDGLQEFYNEWGELVKEEVYRFDCLVEERDYENGKIQSEVIEVQNNNSTEYIRKYYYADGTLESIVPYVNHEIHGVVEIYDNDGRLSRKTIYREGRAISQRTYFENGNLFFETPSFYDEYGLCEKGSGNGEEKVYYENGQLRSVVEHKDRKMEGEQKIYGLNGNLYRVIHYKKGIREGVFERYNSFGGLRVSFLFENGEKNGVATSYRRYDWDELEADNGYKASEVPYKNGKIDGIVKTYYSDESIKSEILFENGEKKSVRKYKKGEKKA